MTMNQVRRDAAGWTTLAILAAGVVSASAQFGGGGNANRNTGATSSSVREYPNSTEVGEAMITSDAQTRSIIVITDDETNDNIREVIATLDRPKPQVLINVVFLQVTHNDDLDVGVEGSFTHTPGSFAGSGGTDFGLAAAQAASGGGFYSLVGDDVSLMIRALAVSGKTEILSRPSILARNNQQATITVGQQVPFITNSRVTDAGQTINTVEYQDIGIILRVTPFITPDGMVEMIVSPEISALSDKTVPISDTVNSPVIDKRAADTVVVTPTGKTIVIGGLISTQKIEQTRKVPILGDIPLLGLAFKRKVKTDVKTELLIFLTPQVIMHPGDLASVSGNETDRLQMAPEVFNQKEMQRYLQDVPGSRGQGLDAAGQVIEN